MIRVIWSMSEVTSAEVVRQIAVRHQWSVSTVKTLLGRLVEKGILATRKAGRCFIYTPLISEDEVILLLGKELLAKIRETKQAQVLDGLIDAAMLTEESVAELIERLQEKPAVAQVKCNCVEDFGLCTMHKQMA